MKNPTLICTDQIKIIYCRDCLREMSRTCEQFLGPRVSFIAKVCEMCEALSRRPLSKALSENLTAEQCAKAAKELDECDGSPRCEEVYN